MKTEDIIQLFIINTLGVTIIFSVALTIALYALNASKETNTDNTAYSHQRRENYQRLRTALFGLLAFSAILIATLVLMHIF